MASLRITEHDVSKVLNQTIRTVTNKHYNHYSYDKEKQQALNKWSRKLQSIISGEPLFRPLHSMELAYSKNKL